MLEDLTSGNAQPIATLQGHAGRVTALCFSSDRCMLASAATDGTARLWDVARSKPRERAVIQKQREGFAAIAFSPNCRRLAAGSATMNGLIWVVDVTDKQPVDIAVLRGARGAIYALAFSPDDKLVAAAGEDRTLRIWEPIQGGSGAARTQLVGHGDVVTALAFAPDGQSIATGSKDGTVRLWSIGRIRSTQRAIMPHPEPVTAVAFVQDGKVLAVAAKGIIALWDLSGWTPRAKSELRGFSGKAMSMKIPMGSASLVGATDDGRAIHWDLETSRIKHEWRFAIGTACSLTVDGRYCASGEEKGSIGIYRVSEKRT